MTVHHRHASSLSALGNLMLGTPYIFCVYNLYGGLWARDQMLAFTITPAATTHNHGFAAPNRQCPDLRLGPQHVICPCRSTPRAPSAIPRGYLPGKRVARRRSRRTSPVPRKGVYITALSSRLNYLAIWPFAHSATGPVLTPPSRSYPSTHPEPRAATSRPQPSASETPSAPRSGPCRRPVC